ncbi:MAG: hypothetical protein AAFX80_17450 [Cyanobacteria bacterium J06639_18]
MWEVWGVWGVWGAWGVWEVWEVWEDEENNYPLPITHYPSLITVRLRAPLR